MDNTRPFTRRIPQPRGTAPDLSMNSREVLTKTLAITAAAFVLSLQWSMTRDYAKFIAGGAGFYAYQYYAYNMQPPAGEMKRLQSGLKSKEVLPPGLNSVNMPYSSQGSITSGWSDRTRALAQPFMEYKHY